MRALRRAPALGKLWDADCGELARRCYFQTHNAGEHLWNEGEMFDGMRQRPGPPAERSGADFPPPGMRFAPVLVRGEVALLKEVVPPGTGGASEEEDETQDDASSQSSEGPPEVEASEELRRERFFGDMAAAAARRALRRALYRAARERHAVGCVEINH